MTSTASSPASLGERLQEARKRRGLSLRDAAEATKIRSDFLSAMEDNSLDIDLPEVYRRGFLKSYARFLKLDPDRAIAEYEDVVARTGARGTEHKSAATHRKSLGRFEIKGHDANTRAASGRADQPIGGDDLSDSSPALISPAALKIGAVVLGLVVIVWIAVSALGQGTPSGTSGNPRVEAGPTPTPTPTMAPALNNRARDSVTVAAISRPVTFMVTDVATGQVLYNNTLLAGSSKTVSRIRSGKVKITFSDRSSALISKDGATLANGQVEEFKFNGSGPGSVDAW